MTRVIVGTVAAALPGLVWGHAGAAPQAHDLWTPDPLVLLPLLLVALAYARGTALLWRRAGRGRGIRHWQAGAFALGLAALFLALVWPLDALAAFSLAAHMGQHMLLTVVAPPLLVLGAPLVPLLRALPGPTQRALYGRWRGLRHTPLRHMGRPGVAFALHAAALWTWHAPAAYQAALASEAVHFFEHLSFVVTGLLFWWSLIHARRYGPNGPPAAALFALGTVIHSGMLGALLTFAPQVLYPVYLTRTQALGLSPLADQQLAGLIMWIPAGFAYVLAGIALAGMWLHQGARHAGVRAAWSED